MARKEHHVVLSSGGGWDVKKGEGKKAIKHFIKKRMRLGTRENQIGNFCSYC